MAETDSETEAAVEIINVPQRRRWTVAEKLRMIGESMKPLRMLSHGEFIRS